MNTSFYDICVEQQKKTIAEFQPHVLVGASYGGALLLDLIRSEYWKGPAVAMCPALLPGTDPFDLPSNVPIFIVHGKKDSVVPFTIAERLISENKNAKNIQLFPIEDAGHNLEPVTNDDTLKQFVLDVWEERLKTDNYVGDDNRFGKLKIKQKKDKCIIS
eukprot:TRINITY_DN3193_c0_g1_i10.p1 TRINITY_DN3193_c0_g1~~TRINITY_DN3193_c0_g1_i10.p1  ORF type:complete len:160 (-),score=37.94 TRINITY_DN3193_c0_g1_i10:409-888(-)